MKLLVSLLVLVTLISALHAQCGTQAPSSALVAFAYMFNGIFYEGQLTSCEQIRNPDIATRPSVIIRPFDVPALYPEWTLYIAEAYNSTIVAERLLVLRMESDGSVRMVPVLFVNDPVRTQGQFDTDFIKTLSLSDLRRRDDCEARYFFQPPNVLTGTWPLCRRYVQENTPFYNSTITCDAWSLAEVKYSLTLHRVLSCARYPLLPYMISEFPDPCPGQRMCRK